MNADEAEALGLDPGGRDGSLEPRYRVWWVPQVPGQPFEVEVDSIELAYALTDVLAKYDLFQYDHRIKPDYANTGGVQLWDHEDGWVDIDESDLLIGDVDEDALPMRVVTKVGTRP